MARERSIYACTVLTLSVLTTYGDQNTFFCFSVAVLVVNERRFYRYENFKQDSLAHTYTHIHIHTTRNPIQNKPSDCNLSFL